MKMLFLTAICCIAGLHAFSQDPKNTVNNKPVQVGVLGGLNLTNITHEEDGEEFKYRAAYRFGAFMKVNLKESLYLNVKAMYSAQGNTSIQELADLSVIDPSDPSFESSDVKIRTKLNYIQVPVTIEYRIGRFGFELGPQVGFNVEAKSTIDYESGKQDVDIANEQSIVFGATLGVNAYVNDKLYIGLNYDRGLSNLYRDVRFNMGDYGSIMYTSEYKYSNFSLTLNYIVF